MDGGGKHGSHHQPPPPPPPCAKDDGEGACRGTWVMGTPVSPYAHPANQQAATWVPVEYSPIPASSAPPAASAPNPNHMNSSSYPPSAVHGSGASSSSYAGGHGPPYGGNPYVQVSQLPGSATKSPMDTILKALGRCGKKLEDSTRKAGVVGGNVWHHLKTSPSVTDAALAKLSQGTKVLAEGGHDKIFQQTFGIFPGEQLWKAYACYLSTSSGPVIGTLYVSNARLAFCSDNSLCNSPAPGQQDWIYYKVVVQLDQLSAVNPSANTLNPAEKYIQIVTTDGHEFWFMGFVSYDKAVRNLTEALRHHSAH